MYINSILKNQIFSKNAVKLVTFFNMPLFLLSSYLLEIVSYVIKLYFIILNGHIIFHCDKNKHP